MSEENQIQAEEDDKKLEYDSIYKEIQNGIKDKVISKFLLTIQQQSKELTELRKENTLLKNQLTYILKRILLNKSDFNYAVKTTRINNLNNSLYYNKSMIVNNNNKKSSSNMLRPLRSVENYRVVSDNLNNLNYKENNNNSSINVIGGENNGYLNTASSVDNKVSSYLNSLYRHNFNNGTRNNYFLNKKNTLIEELFPNKNNSFYLNTEIEPSINQYGTQIKQKSMRKDLSTEKRDNKNVNKLGRKSAERRNKTKYLNVNNNSVKKRNKGYNIKYERLNGKNNYNTMNINNNENQAKKNKTKKIQIYPKRSPFLVNKF